MEKLKGIIQKWNSISLVKRIICGLIIGIILGLVVPQASAISILGDLSFSLIKRSCHIKDFGQVIPGHGGILDRFDSVIFTVPYVFFLVQILPLVIK